MFSEPGALNSEVKSRDRFGSGSSPRMEGPAAHRWRKKVRLSKRLNRD
jgi:hypothetical protein